MKEPQGKKKLKDIFYEEFLEKIEQANKNKAIVFEEHRNIFPFKTFSTILKEENIYEIKWQK